MTPIESRSILVVSADPVERETLGRALASLGKVELSSGMEQLNPRDLTALSYDVMTASERNRLLGFLKAESAESTILLGGATLRRDLGRLFTETRTAHVIARNEGAVDSAELLTTARKILGQEVLGMEAYFPAGARKSELTIADSSRKSEVVSEVQEFAKGLRTQSRIVSLISNVADELVANALYDAPVDAGGRRCFAELPRTETVRLDAPQEVRVKLCGDERRLGISVADPFGSLDREGLQRNLGRCLRSATAEALFKPGGAGLGLYLVFQSVSQLVVNLSPGKCTEVIGIIDPSASYREFAAANKSVNVFVTAASSGPSAPPG